MSAGPNLYGSLRGMPCDRGRGSARAAGAGPAGQGTGLGPRSTGSARSRPTSTCDRLHAPPATSAPSPIAGGSTSARRDPAARRIRRIARHRPRHPDPAPRERQRVARPEAVHRPLRGLSPDRDGRRLRDGAVAPSLGSATDRQIAQAVRSGLRDAALLAPAISDAQLDSIIAYVRIRETPRRPRRPGARAPRPRAGRARDLARGGGGADRRLRRDRNEGCAVRARTKGGGADRRCSCSAAPSGGGRRGGSCLRRASHGGAASSWWRSPARSAACAVGFVAVYALDRLPDQEQLLGASSGSRCSRSRQP